MSIARYFHHHLIENPQLNGLLQKVVFAILHHSKDESIINPFQAIFAPT